MSTIRTCEQSLRRCKRALSVRVGSVTAPRREARDFSSTPSRRKNGPLPALTPTSNPPLDALLTDIKHKIFVPSHLRKAQQNLIYRDRHASMLAAEPFTIDIGIGSSRQESVQLQHIDRTKDVPDSWKSLLEIMQLMATSPDAWRNLVPTLQGFHTAKRRWSSAQLQRIIRTAGERGMAWAMLDGIRRAHSTGLVLRDVPTVREAFWATRAHALSHSWDDVAIAQALRYAQQLALVLNEPAHLGRRVGGVRDPRRQPDIIAVLLELAAMRATSAAEADDEARKLVSVYARRVLDNLHIAVSLPAVEPQTEEKIALRADYELLRWLPVVNGLRLAQRVLGEAMPVPSEGRGVEECLGEVEVKVKSWSAEAAKVQFESADAYGRGRGRLWEADLKTHK